eukprot:TRINITY_DN1670_c0_g2_i3.p1 TRINITY_DN1670_c0_g2~~TRINITY_DN1670_c0_g2_i3.p1  ORF type:complete len:104 (+),score=5.54 TRINITY_DN1670_c0_g2_i3:138-449(+)
MLGFETPPEPPMLVKLLLLLLLLLLPPPSFPTRVLAGNPGPTSTTSAPFFFVAVTASFSSAKFCVNSMFRRFPVFTVTLICSSNARLKSRPVTLEYWQTQSCQ